MWYHLFTQKKTLVHFTLVGTASGIKSMVFGYESILRPHSRGTGNSWSPLRDPVTKLLLQFCMDHSRDINFYPFDILIRQISSNIPITAVYLTIKVREQFDLP